MVEYDLAKVEAGVQFPSPAPLKINKNTHLTVSIFLFDGHVTKPMAVYWSEAQANQYCRIRGMILQEVKMSNK